MLNEWDQAEQDASPITVEQLDEWGRKWKKAKQDLEVASAHKTELEKVKEEIEGKFVEALNQAGRKKYHVEGIGLVGFWTRMSVQTPKTIADKQALAKYMEEKYGKVFFWDKFSVNSQTLQSFYNKEFEIFEEKSEAQGPQETAFHIPGLAPPVAKIGLKTLSKDKATKQGETNE